MEYNRFDDVPGYSDTEQDSPKEYFVKSKFLTVQGLDVLNFDYI